MSTLSKIMTNSRATEILSAAKRMIREFEDGDWSSETKLTSIFDELKPANLKLEKSINNEKAISDLEEKDEVRDEKVRAIYYTLTGYLHNPDTSIKASAENVDKVFERYGLKIIDESYSAESGFISSLLTDLLDAALETSISALPGLSQLITELQTAQSEFETARLAYQKDAAKDKSEKSATVLKQDVADILNKKLVVYLRAMSTMEEVTYGEITNTIGKIIDDNNVEVKKRRKKVTPEQ
ncbi:MAG: hypothetical protein JEY94_14655 [Melioribacteraceae bacterium]|nr:hypothetical protein [Melioribacteraceae bacterium]